MEPDEEVGKKIKIIDKFERKYNEVKEKQKESL